MGGITDALEFPGCADFQPLDYLDGLAAAFKRRGGRIYENTQIMKNEGDQVSKICIFLAFDSHPKKIKDVGCTEITFFLSSCQCL